MCNSTFKAYSISCSQTETKVTPNDMSVVSIFEFNSWQESHFSQYQTIPVTVFFNNWPTQCTNGLFSYTSCMSSSGCIAQISLLFYSTYLNIYIFDFCPFLKRVICVFMLFSNDNTHFEGILTPPQSFIHFSITLNSLFIYCFTSSPLHILPLCRLFY